MERAVELPRALTLVAIVLAVVAADIALFVVFLRGWSVETFWAFVNVALSPLIAFTAGAWW
jgi:hypothetical protein